MKGKNLQPRFPYPARLSYRFDAKIKSFPGKQKLKEFSNTKTALQQMLQSRNTREEKNLQNQPQIIKKMAIGTYI